MNPPTLTASPSDSRKPLWHPYENQLTFKKSDFDKIPSNAFGIYGLWYGKRCIYIGMAERQPIARRLEQHWRGSHNPDLADWIRAKGSQLRVSYVMIKNQPVTRNLEKQYIKQFQPLTNRHLK